MSPMAKPVSGSENTGGIAGTPVDQEDPRADLVWGTIPRLVEDVASRHSWIEALVDGDLRLTFAELAPEVDRYARAFVPPVSLLVIELPCGHPTAPNGCSPPGRTPGRRRARPVEHSLQRW